MKKNKIKLFVIPIILIVLFLIIQAFCDLELPQYTSDIINNGIQQKGINKAIPEILTEDVFNAIVKISKENKKIISSYELINNLSDTKRNEIIKKYSLSNNNLYIINDLTKEEKNILEKNISKPFLIAMMLKSNNSELKTMLNINNDNLLEYVMTLDDNGFNNIVDNITITLDNYDENILKQYTINSIKEEYNNIGLNLEKYQMSYIINKGVIMLCIAFGGMAVAIIVGYLTSKLAATISYTLRKKVVSKIMSYSQSEFNEFGASSLITRSTNDIEQVKNFFVMLLRIVIFAPIIGIGAFIKVVDNPLNWLIAVALIVLLIVISILFGIAMPKFKRIQKLIDNMNLVSREIITGMPVIRTFGTEKYEENRFDNANQNLTNIHLFVNRLMGIMFPSMMLIMNLVSILIIWFGAKEVNLGNLQVGTLLAFISYTMQIIMAFLMISLVSVMLPRALVSLKRIKEILKKEITIKEIDKPKSFNKDKIGEIEFKNVTFKYPDASEAMLKDISFKITPGTTTAFIGSTGSGKSTLINLIPRFFDVTNGEILVDGINIKDASLKDLRKRIGYVPQKGILFSGNIESNLKLGNELLSLEEMMNVSKVSESWEFIENKEDTFKSNISQGGSNVSGGQKQRLAIARAIAKNPEIYIFDDSFSALDFKTDAKLRKNLKEYAKNATILIVAQRISTIMNADNIIVLEEGKIVGNGTHKELMKSCKIYQEIALSQLKEEEL